MYIKPKIVYVSGEVEIRCKRHNIVVEPDNICPECLNEVTEGDIDDS